MANEISLIKADGSSYRLLLLFPIPSPSTYTNGLNLSVAVVPTPSASLDSMSASILTPAEKAALDNGTLAFETIDVAFRGELTAAEILAEARAKYAQRKALFNAAYARHYPTRIGNRFNAV